MSDACTNQCPRWFTGHWRDWHRGHGCDIDDGKPRSAEALAEIARHATPPDRSTPETSDVVSSTEMKQIDPTTDTTWEEAWFRLDPTDLQICIRVLGAAIPTLTQDEQVIVGEVIGCMAEALSRSEKQQHRDAIVAGDVAAVLSAVGKTPQPAFRRRKTRAAKVETP